MRKSFGLSQDRRAPDNLLECVENLPWKDWFLITSGKIGLQLRMIKMCWSCPIIFAFRVRRKTFRLLQILKYLFLSPPVMLFCFCFLMSVEPNLIYNIWKQNNQLPACISFYSKWSFLALTLVKGTWVGQLVPSPPSSPPPLSVHYLLCSHSHTTPEGDYCCAFAQPPVWKSTREILLNSSKSRFVDVLGFGVLQH